MTTPHDPWWDGTPHGDAEPSAADPAAHPVEPDADATPPVAGPTDLPADGALADADPGPVEPPAVQDPDLGLPDEPQPSVDAPVAEAGPTEVEPAEPVPAEDAPVAALPVEARSGPEQDVDAQPHAVAAHDTAADGADDHTGATDVTAADAAAAPDGTVAAAAGRSRRDLVALVAALVVVALLAAGVALLGLRVRDGQRTETAREQAVAASRDAARLLFSYDHSTLDADFARGLAVTTGAFREEYTKTTRDVVADVAREYKAVVLADVVESAVVDAEPDRVRTIVFLNQATTSTRVEGQQVDASRVLMTLVERDGRWLVSQVEAL